MPSEFSILRRVQFAETDMAGVAHFSSYFRWMEETEHAFFRSLGFSIHEEFEGRTIGWPRVSASCDFSGPLRFEEEVEIHLIVTEVRTRSIRYQFVFRRLPDSLEVARGAVATVCSTVDRLTGKLAAMPIPERIRERLTASISSSSSSP